jgi:hypothetical protein
MFMQALAFSLGLVTSHNLFDGLDGYATFEIENINDLP